MLICKKFDEKDLEILTATIIRLKDDDNTICKKEIYDLRDHIYYLIDTKTNYIAAVIVGYRNMIDDLSISQYVIKYLLYDEAFFNLYDELNFDEALTWLVREFDADKRGLSIRYNIPDPENEDIHIKRALRTNGYTIHLTKKFYLKVYRPIDNLDRFLYS